MSTPIGLAIDGGQPHLSTRLVAAWPSPVLDDEAQLVHALQRRAVKRYDVGSRSIASSSIAWRDPVERSVRLLERRWRDATGMAHVVACRSGVVAASLALAGLEIGPDDEVICPADSFLTATAFAAASPAVAVFVDLDPTTLHLDPDAVEAAITDRTRAILVVDLHGTTGDYRRLAAVAERHGLAIIEECSQSIGAEFDHRPVGSLGTVSLCSLDSGESSLGAAGLFATDDATVAAVARRLTMIEDEIGVAPQGQETSLAGWGYRVAELDAAMADARLARLGDEAATRTVNGNHLRCRLSAVPGIWTPELVRGATNVYSAFPLLVVPDELGLPEESAAALRDTVVDCMTAEGLWIDRWLPGSLPTGEVRSRVDLYFEQQRREDRPARATDASRPIPPPGSDRDISCIRSEFPVADAAWSSGLLLGPNRSPFGEPHATESMDEIADCFSKLLVDNLDRVRQLTLERLSTPAMF